MGTFCPHCREEVGPEDLLDGEESWTCALCQHGNPDDADDCEICSLSRETSEHFDENGGVPG